MPIIRSLSTAAVASGLPRNVVAAVLLAQPDRQLPTALLPPRSYGKPEAAAAAAVDRSLMMGIRMPETC